MARTIQTNRPTSSPSPPPGTRASAAPAPGTSSPVTHLPTPPNLAMFRQLRASLLSPPAASHPLSLELSRLEAQVAALRRQMDHPPVSPFRRVFLMAATSPRAAAAKFIHLTRRRRVNVLLEVAKLCLCEPVARPGDRRALRAVTALLCDEVLRRDPHCAEAMCLKGESMLPYLLYGKNDPGAPPSVLQEAYELFDKASQAGNTLGLFLKGRWLLSMEIAHTDKTEAELGRDCVKAAAEANNPRALVFLAHRYEYPLLDRGVRFEAELPKGKPQRERFILDFYRRAAEFGNADALNDIGTSFSEGYGGLDKDFDQAAHYYAQAIDRGSLHAYDNLGTHYETGMGGRVCERIDFAKALYYYRQGARQRCPKSCHNLAAAYEEGMGPVLSRNPEHAEKYYRLALLLADDHNDVLTAHKVLKDIVSMYILRIKLNGPHSDVGVKTRRRLLRYVPDEAFIDAAIARVDKAAMVALKGKWSPLMTLIGTLNAKILIAHVRTLEAKIRAATATEGDMALHRAALGLKSVETNGGTGARARTPSRKKTSNRPKKRRRT